MSSSSSTSLPQHHNNFELLRLLAATQVLLGHGIEHLHIPVAPALKAALGIFPGVSIFFVISGFLITGSLLRSPDLGSYARNRFLRIFPGLWMCTLVTLVLLYSTQQVHASAGQVALWAMAQGTFAPHTPDYLRHWGTGSVNGSLWTIPVEIQFYVLLPLLVWWLRPSTRRQAGTMAALILCGCAYLWLRQNYAGQLPARILLMSLLSWLYLFLVGVLLRLHWGRVAHWFQGRALWWGLGYLAWVSLLQMLGVAVQGNAATPLSTIPLGLLTIALAHTAPQLSWRLLRGQDLSYGLYIYHMLVINYMVEQQWTGTWAMLAAAAAMSLLLAGLSWRYLESPALKLKAGRRLQAKQADPA